MAILRKVGAAILADRFGWFTVWGGTGSAKTLFLQALVVGFCQAGIQAVYYHAADLRNGLLRDVDNPDSDNAAYYRRVPVLVVDELDKYHMTDWSRGQLQALLDERYRHMQTQVTLFAANKDPLDSWLPEDIQSRLQDGRFNRSVGDQEIPGIYHIRVPDIRPSLRRKELP